MVCQRCHHRRFSRFLQYDVCPVDVCPAKRPVLVSVHRVGERASSTAAGMARDPLKVWAGRSTRAIRHAIGGRNLRASRLCSRPRIARGAVCRPACAGPHRVTVACGRPEPDALAVPGRDRGPWSLAAYQSRRRRICTPTAATAGIEHARPCDLRPSVSRRSRAPAARSRDHGRTRSLQVPETVDGPTTCSKPGPLYAGETAAHIAEVQPAADLIRVLIQATRQTTAAPT